jgi:hypothetical protein
MTHRTAANPHSAFCVASPRLFTNHESSPSSSTTHIMAIKFLNEEYRRLIEQLAEVNRRPIYDNQDLRADLADKKRDFVAWCSLWDAYYIPHIRPLLSDEHRREFESKHDRCARVTKMRDKVWACEKKKDLTKKKRRLRGNVVCGF